VKLPPFAYHRPRTVDEALGLLAEHAGESKVLAGGQSLLPVLALRLSHPAHLIDVSRLSELGSVAAEAGSVVVGAAVTHAAAETSPVVSASAPLVAGAMPFVGHRAVRSRGTVGGSLAHADPAAELPAVALATEAEMIVRGQSGERNVNAADFFEGYLSSAVGEEELLVGVRFPAWATGAGWSVQEVSRRHGDFALVGLATVVELDEKGVMRRTALSFFGAASTPVRVTAAEELLEGCEPDLSLFDQAATLVSDVLRPPDDDHASSAYRAHVAGVLTRRGLAEATARATATVEATA